jgi:error-prone DNA polymerase
MAFPESHAASFAKIAYASCWMKHHHPDVFCASLLNAQPMGFYAPAQIVADARKHGVEVRPVRSITAIGIARSNIPIAGIWPYALASGRCGVWPMSMVRGSSRRGAFSPYGSVEEVWRRAGVPRAAIERLAEADAFAAIAQDRRQGLWKVKGWAMPPASSRRPMRRRISFHLR